MCVYCGNGMSAHIISEEQGEDLTPGLYAYIMGGLLHIDIDGDAWYEFEAPVNYCLMCGRKLGGDDE